MNKIHQLDVILKRINRRLRAYTEEPVCTEDAAKFLSISISTLHKLTSRGEIAHYKPNGKQMYFKKKDLRKYAFAKKIKTVEELANSITINKKK